MPHRFSTLLFFLNLDCEMTKRNKNETFPAVLAGLAFSFSLGVLLQILVRIEHSSTEK